MNKVFFNLKRSWSLLCLCILLAWTPLLGASGGDPLSGLAELPPGERYRQLSLLVLLVEAADEELMQFMSGESEALLAPGPGQVEALQQYPTPLARIADPDSMLEGAAQMLQFAQTNRAAIEQELARIEESWPILVSMIDMNAVREDAIIIRSALADSLQYQVPMGELDENTLPVSSLVAYQGETVHQRNNMEYLLFQGELDQITDSAINDLGYKLDAYQRMADEELDPVILGERIEAAENMNDEARERFREQAYIRASTLYLMLIPALVTVATD
jgi:hypothetical protein